MLSHISRLLRDYRQTLGQASRGRHPSPGAIPGPSFEPLEARLMMSITLNVSAGDLLKSNGATALPLGSTMVLLVDANNNHSFGDLTQATGTFIGDPGDVVLSRFASNDFLDNPGSYQASLVFANDPSLTGKDVLLVWYDKAYNAGDAGPGAGVHFGTFTAGSWTVPSDAATTSLTFLTGSEGGAEPNSAGIANQVTAGASANVAPVLTAIGDKTVNELATLAFTAQASDSDTPAQTLTYSLDSTSLAAAMTINASTGAFSWTPTEAQGPGVYPVTVTVTDNGTPNLTDSKSFNITVSEVNSKPTLGAISDKTIAELANLTFTATATDTDIPANTLTYSLDAASVTAGMTIDPGTGVFSWTPTEAQGPSVEPVTITATDNGTPTNLSDSKTFNITVNEVNVAPVLTAVSDKSVAQASDLTFTASATDADLPANTLAYSLDATSLGLGMTIDPSTGVFDWTPAALQTAGVYPVTITVTDNDTPALTDSKGFNITVTSAALPTVTVAATDANASETGPDTGTFTVTRTGPTAAALDVIIAMSGTATNGTDYATVNTTVTIPAGQASTDVTVTPVDDAEIESAETAILTISPDATYTVGANNAATVTIADNDLPVVTVAATDAAASETGPDNGTFTVARTGPTTAALNVTIAMSGTATNGSDYTTINTTVTIPAGQASTDVTLTPVDDAAIEGPETAILTISPNAAYTVGANDSATVAIADNDLPVVTVAATDASAAEAGLDTGTFTVTRTGPTTAALDVTIAMSGTATNGTDYTTINTTVTIPAGQASADVTLTPIDDVLGEGPETAIMTIAPDAAYTVGGSNSATVDIADDDIPVVTVAATDASASETGPDTGTFTVTRTGSTTAALDVTIAMSGTATNGTDYTTVNTTVTIPAGQASADVTLTPVDDAEIEGQETAILTIAPDATYSVGASSSATVNIADNDLPVVTVAATDAAASETGPDNGTFTVTRTGPTTTALNVTIAMSGAATNGTDYTTVNTTVTIPAGQASATVTLAPINDVAIEGPETAILTISPNAAYTVGGSNSATVNIADNDLPVVTVAATDASAAEAGPDTGTFTVTRTGPTTAALDVTIAMSGTATNGTDYTTVNTTVTIPAGQASTTVTITPVDDAAIEPTETAILTVAPAAGYTIGGSGSATVNLLDNDSAQAPNLKVVFDTNLPVKSPMIPGDVNVLTGTASNNGLVATPAVPVYVNIYLLPTAQNTPGVNDLPVGQAKIDGTNLTPGDTVRWSIKTVVPDTLLAGSYHFVAFVDAHQAIAEVSETDNFAAMAPANLVLALGELAGRPRVGKLVLGGITYQYTGPGSVTITPGVGGNPDSVTVSTDATPKAVLSITGPAHRSSAIGGITVNGSLKAIKLVNVTLQGNVAVTGILTSFRGADIVGDQNTLTISGTDAAGKAALSFIAGDVSDLSIASPNLPINLISVTQWQDTDASRDTITAPLEKTITSRGEFNADISATSATATFGLGSLTVRGVLETTLRSVDSIKSVRAGAIVDSLIFAGVMPSVTTLPASAAAFLAGSAASINSVTATGSLNGASASFVNSIIAAPTLGTIALDDVMSDNGGTLFGIVAENQIKQFRRTFSPVLTNLATPGDALIDGDFVLRIV